MKTLLIVIAVSCHIGVIAQTTSLKLHSRTLKGDHLKAGPETYMAHCSISIVP